MGRLKSSLLMLMAALVVGCETQPTKPEKIETTSKEASQGAAEFEAPNILIMQADDLGYDDIAAHGGRFAKTPNLDKLASDSMSFKRFYVSPLCAPTRASFLTGRNFLRTGVSHVHGGRDFIHLGETLLPQYFKERGFSTAMWGKWHSGKTDGYFPWDRGFDEAYYPSLYNYDDNVGLLNGEEIQNTGYGDDSITDMAIDYISNSRDKKPFLAYVSFMAPHNPWRAPQYLVEENEAEGQSFAEARLYGMVEALDANIGRILQALEDHELADNTIVLFLSDNGPWHTSYQFGMTEEEFIARNPSGLRGRKSVLFENGIRSPLFVKWPNVLESGIVDTPAIAEDILPTLLDLVGADIPADRFDGSSLKTALSGEVSSELDDRELFVFAQTVVSGGKGNMPAIRASAGESIIPSKQRAVHFHKEQKTLLNVDGKGVYQANVATDPGEDKLIKLSGDDEARAAKKFVDRFEELTASPHALQMPVFQIGFDGRKVSRIYAAAAYDHSDALNVTSHFISSWDKKGEWAEYAINVATPGVYDVHLTTWSEAENKSSFKLSTDTGQSSFVAAVTTTLSPGTLILNESAYWQNIDNSNSFLPEVKTEYVASINLTAQDSKLRLTLENLNGATTSTQENRIVAIHLRHRADVENLQTKSVEMIGEPN